MNKKDRYNWEEFRSSGLLWAVNSFLHLFGFAIVFDYDDKDKLLNKVYISHTRFRGFSEECNDREYKHLTEYMKNNADKLYKEGFEEENKSGLI